MPWPNWRTRWRRVADSHEANPCLVPETGHIPNLENLAFAKNTSAPEIPGYALHQKTGRTSSPHSALRSYAMTFQMQSVVGKETILEGEALTAPRLRGSGGHAAVCALCIDAGAAFGRAEFHVLILRGRT